MSPHFVRNAVRNGDACHAVREGATLVSSAWYSRRPTSIGTQGLVLHFAPGYVYMYKGLTCDAYRGQRLYAVGISRALAHYTAQGARGLVSYVEATNLAAMKAARRMGFRVFGSVYLIRLFGRHFAFSSPGCKAFGFRLEEKATELGPRPGVLDERRRQVEQLAIGHRSVAANPGVEHGFRNAEPLGQRIATYQVFRPSQDLLLRRVAGGFRHRSSATL